MPSPHSAVRCSARAENLASARKILPVFWVCGLPHTQNSEKKGAGLKALVFERLRMK
jgi:hypothetical protein